MYTLLYLKWITKKHLLYGTKNSAQCYVAAWMEWEFGGEWILVYVWLSHSAVGLKPLQHCLISYTLIQKSPFFISPTFPWIPKHGVKRWLHRRIRWLPELPELVKDTPLFISQHIIISLLLFVSKIFPAVQMV